MGLTTIAEQLGHASVAFTISTYGHLMRGREERVRAAQTGYINRRNGATTQRHLKVVG